MIIEIEYYLSAAITLTITLIAANFFVAPYAAAQGFGVAVAPNARWDAYLSAKAIRDFGVGIFIAMLIAARSNQLLGSFLLVVTIIQLADGVVVLKHGGRKAAAFGIHGAMASISLITSSSLLLG